MLDVVATTPSSPLGACRLVTLDMAPRCLCGWIYVARLRKKVWPGNLFYTPWRREFPSARLAGKCPDLQVFATRDAGRWIPDCGQKSKEPARRMATGSSHSLLSNHINGRARELDPNAAHAN